MTLLSTINKHRNTGKGTQALFFRIVSALTDTKLMTNSVRRNLNCWFDNGSVTVINMRCSQYNFRSVHVCVCMSELAERDPRRSLRLEDEGARGADVF